MAEIRRHEGARRASWRGSSSYPPGARFALVASRFNHFIVDHLVEGALDALARHGADPANVTVVRVPGAWEIPLRRPARRRASEEALDAVIALAAVIRGSTPHFDYVVGRGLQGGRRPPRSRPACRSRSAS